MLFNEIEAIHCGDESALISMLERFEPLINKYGKKLGGEDGRQEMTISLIVLLRHLPLDKLSDNSDGIIVNYISRSIYHDYIKRSIAVNRVASYESQLDEHITSEFRYDHFEDLLSSADLTDLEADTLRLIFKYGYSATEIAKSRATTRQNVNQIKQRALKKVRQIL